MKFEAVEDLVEQMHDDSAKARAVLSGNADMAPDPAIRSFWTELQAK